MVTHTILVVIHYRKWQLVVPKSIEIIEHVTAWANEHNSLESRVYSIAASFLIISRGVHDQHLSTILKEEVAQLTADYPNVTSLEISSRDEDMLAGELLEQSYLFAQKGRDEFCFFVHGDTDYPLTAITSALSSYLRFGARAVVYRPQPSSKTVFDRYQYYLGMWAPDKFGTNCRITLDDWDGMRATFGNELFGATTQMIGNCRPLLQSFYTLNGAFRHLLYETLLSGAHAIFMINPRVSQVYCPTFGERNSRFNLLAHDEVLFSKIHNGHWYSKEYDTLGTFAFLLICGFCCFSLSWYGVIVMAFYAGGYVFSRWYRQWMFPLYLVFFFEAVRLFETVRYATLSIVDSSIVADPVH